jgi:hypothetical protein
MGGDAGGVLPPLLDGKLLMRMPEARFRLLLPGDASSGTQLYKVSCRPVEGILLAALRETIGWIATEVQC